VTKPLLKFKLITTYSIVVHAYFVHGTRGTDPLTVESQRGRREIKILTLTKYADSAGCNIGNT